MEVKKVIKLPFLPGDIVYTIYEGRLEKVRINQIQVVVDMIHGEGRNESYTTTEEVWGTTLKSDSIEVPLRSCYPDIHEAIQNMMSEEIYREWLNSLPSSLTPPEHPVPYAKGDEPDDDAEGEPQPEPKEAPELDPQYILENSVKVQYTGGNLWDIQDFLGGGNISLIRKKDREKSFTIHRGLRDDIHFDRVLRGDWILKVDGHYYNWSNHQYQAHIKNITPQENG